MHHFQPTAVNYLFLPSICIGLGIADAKWQNILELQAALGSDGMHRADIDGLRAVAVVSVVLFHFKLFPNYIRGGFIGVDVFFVISGYLITGIILKGIDDGSYSVANFYNRRIRRI